MVRERVDARYGGRPTAEEDENVPTSEECCRKDGVYERRPKPARSREWIRRIDPHKMTVVSSSVHE